MTPIVSIVGNSLSGKTTLIEKLLKELKSRGYRVATIKHTHKKLEFDEPGKDSWRHVKAGSEVTVISSPGYLKLIKPVTKDTSPEEIAHLVGEEYDIILTEGFKKETTPKIETHRKEAGPPLKGIELIAVATDEPLETKVRQFSLDDTKGIADLLENDFIKPHRERLALYVNGSPIPLTPFPENIITNILMGLASSLKGVKEIKNIEIFLRRAPAKGAKKR